MALTFRQHKKVRELREKFVWPRPLGFDEFVNLFEGRKEIVELIDGEVIFEMTAQLDHEILISWLHVVLKQYAEVLNLGIVLGSRTPVRIDKYNGRLPDILLVKLERMEIVQQKAIYGAPDLVLEVRSPSSRKSSIIGLETDYRTLRVQEIVFIDPSRRKVRVLRKRGEVYDELDVSSPFLNLESIPGMMLQTEWLFSESRPTPLTVVTQLLAANKY